MADEIAYLNLLAAKAGLKPFAAEDGEDVGLESNFVADTMDYESAKGDSASRKRPDRDGGEEDPSSKKS
ncbi:hypothetical protein A2U01_0071934, partial [Trifolium medium]|nr:hypothetical protein [Trifolium medium]